MEYYAYFLITMASILLFVVSFNLMNHSHSKNTWLVGILAFIFIIGTGVMSYKYLRLQEEVEEGYVFQKKQWYECKKNDKMQKVWEVLTTNN